MQACLVVLGIALLPLAMIDEHVKSNRLQVVLERVSTGVGGLYIIYPGKKTSFYHGKGKCRFCNL